MRCLQNRKKSEVDYQSDLCVFSQPDQRQEVEVHSSHRGGGQIRATDVSVSRSVLAGRGQRHLSGIQVCVSGPRACPQAIISLGRGVRVGLGRCQSRAAASERTRALPSPSIAG